MRFQVPQFIEVEDKIFGPLTFKQFVYVAGGAGISFVLWSVIPKFLAVLIILPVLAFSFALAFYKVNNKPFINVVEASLRYLAGSKLYIWKKELKKADAKKAATADTPAAYIPKLSDSKLRQIAWELDIHDKAQR
jgi:hypothetical protein